MNKILCPKCKKWYLVKWSIIIGEKETSGILCEFCDYSKEASDNED